MQCATQARPVSQPTSSNCSTGRRPKCSRQYESSSGSSARWVCSRTSSRSASSAVRTISSGLTLNGEHGASATRTMAPQPGSWCAATSRSLSASTSSSSCTTESGGSPPSLTDSVIEPRVGWNRRPTSRAAAISADHRSPPPRGATYRWSVLVVQPPRASSARPTQADRYAASSSRPAHSGYRPDSHWNSVPLTVGAYDLVRFWYRWWWVLTRPGVTRQPLASRVCVAGGTGSAGEPTPVMRPPVTATQPPASSRRCASQVTTSLAPVTTRSALLVPLASGPPPTSPFPLRWRVVPSSLPRSFLACRSSVHSPPRPFGSRECP